MWCVITGVSLMKSRSVDDGFVELVKKLEPQFSECENNAAYIHRIEKKLKASHDMKYLISYGSLGHGTHIKGYSSSDHFAVMPKSKLFENSLDSLKKVHSSLVDIFPDGYIIEGRPSITIHYGEAASEKHHIVPAFVAGEKDGHDVFGIPGPSGRWIKSCPGGHSSWINKLDVQLSQRLKMMIRIMKAWNYFNNKPLWSYYIELAMAEFLKSDYEVMYSLDFRNFLKYLVRIELKPIEGSIGSSELVYATSKDEKYSVLRELNEAIYKSGKAIKFENRGDIFEAYFWWRKVFNFHFPAYEKG